MSTLPSTGHPPASTGLHRPFLHEHGRLIPLVPAELVAIEAHDKHITLHLISKKKHSLEMPLRQLVALLALEELQQVHRSWVVNLRFIEHIDTKAGTILLPHDLTADLGRAYRDQLLARLLVLR